MKKVDYYKTFLLYIKMGKTTYYKKNKQRNNIKYSKRLLWKYENNKEVLREKAKNLHRELSKEEKNIERDMEEIDIKIYLNKGNKDWRSTKKLSWSYKTKNLWFW